ncbi:OmpA/MotB family protein [Alcaligenes sp. SDU_A2]|uniref:OmpA/MotB family protein n=1 Tax=Alcaligenes sp. SDU_A2 TaxID=3136634 RepID=UPI002D106972|nr:OmpA family protein [Alcaligenes sp.]HRL26503.1 OmpA family protein [Alcaligenes sp.]
MFQSKSGPKKAAEDADHWMSVSDLMSGLMIVFLFISILLMRNALGERDKIKEVAVTYQNNQVALYENLKKEFQNDLDAWNADIDPLTLAFEFKSPDVLFQTGSAIIKPAFRHILDDFFPRYLKVLSQFRHSLNEIRIEGHTSSQWNQQTPPEEAYFRNMALSQERTRSVLLYIQNMDAVKSEKEWIRQNMAAVGFSSSRLVLDEHGHEDAERSRRVSFRVMTNAETQIRKILQD